VIEILLDPVDGFDVHDLLAVGAEQYQLLAAIKKSPTEAGLSVRGIKRQGRPDASVLQFPRHAR
jgi:hypothetical protein